jgi:hypothetical protein
MRAKQVGQLILTVAAICTVSTLSAYPVNAQSQTEEQERLHGSLFYQCRERIEEKEDGGYISREEALHLGSDLADLQKRDLKYTYQRYRSSGNREDFYQHDPALVSQAQSIINHLNQQTIVNEEWKRSARDRMMGIMHPGDKPWPPRDDDGKIIAGPRQFGTAEQMGWPMWGWSKEERARYVAGGHVRITSRRGNIAFGVIEN